MEDRQLFAKESAGPLEAIETKTTEAKINGEVGVDIKEMMSDRIPWRSVGLLLDAIARVSTWESILRQMCVRLIDAACRSADLIAKASVIRGDETWSWKLEPLVNSEAFLVVKIHPRPAASRSALHEASLLQKIKSSELQAEASGGGCVIVLGVL